LGCAGRAGLTVAHDHHNLVIDRRRRRVSMMDGGRAVADMRGGIAVADGDQCVARLPLPVAGLMSRPPHRRDSPRVRCADRGRTHLGSPLHDPFMAMSFMALEVIPKLKLTDLGLVDVEQFKIVDLFVG
jgi:adenine deaminase